MTTSCNGENLSRFQVVNRDWAGARQDIVNGLLRMADEARTAREETCVLRMTTDARDAGLLSAEEAHHITLIADARLQSLGREDQGSGTPSAIN